MTEPWVTVVVTKPVEVWVSMEVAVSVVVPTSVDVSVVVCCWVEVRREVAVETVT